MLIDELMEEGVINAPKWMKDNCAYLVQVGSSAYLTTTPSSDVDVYGFCVPPKELVFPHLQGYIPGFGEPVKPYEQWQEHQITSASGKEYDFTVYSIVKFFHLAAQNNPNMVDALFVPQRCVLHCTKLGAMVRDNRHLFLSKRTYDTHRKYAYSQVAKLATSVESANPKRRASIAQFGYDTKAALHLFRLMFQCEQILKTGDLDLEANGEILRSVRAGELSLVEVNNWFESKAAELQVINDQSSLPDHPDYTVIRTLLLDCLETHYHSLADAVKRDVPVARILQDMQALIDRYS